MTYARLCEHGEVKAHVHQRFPDSVEFWDVCPGGSVLPDDTLVLVRFVCAMPDHDRNCKCPGYGYREARSGVVIAAAALAAAQGSQETNG